MHETLDLLSNYNSRYHIHIANVAVPDFRLSIPAMTLPLRESSQGGSFVLGMDHLDGNAGDRDFSEREPATVAQKRSIYSTNGAQGFQGTVPEEILRQFSATGRKDHMSESGAAFKSRIAYSFQSRGQLQIQQMPAVAKRIWTNGLQPVRKINQLQFGTGTEAFLWKFRYQRRNLYGKQRITEMKSICLNGFQTAGEKNLH